MTTSPIINNNSVTLFVGPETDVSALAPEFTLTPGATISPLSGTVHDFNLPQNTLSQQPTEYGKNIYSFGY